MTIDLAAIPSRLDEPTDRWRRSQVRKEIIDRSFSRRSPFKAVFAIGTAIGLASLDGFATLSGSYAATNWGECANWHNLVAWRPNNQPPFPEAPPVRCSDGQVRDSSGGSAYSSWENSTCKHSLA